jgi:Uma2 family endonuclease
MDDFMVWEAEQTERHEYLEGEVFAMTGARDAHNTIAGNLFATLRNHLRGSPCRAFIAGMKLRVDPADAVFYPDLMVTCDPRDRGPGTGDRKPILPSATPSCSSKCCANPPPPTTGASSSSATA